MCSVSLLLKRDCECVSPAPARAGTPGVRPQSVITGTLEQMNRARDPEGTYLRYLGSPSPTKRQPA